MLKWNKWYPHIKVYCLELIYDETNEVFQRLYFLRHSSTEKFLKKNTEIMKENKLSWGCIYGVTVWL